MPVAVATPPTGAVELLKGISATTALAASPTVVPILASTAGGPPPPSLPNSCAPLSPGIAAPPMVMTCPAARGAPPEPIDILPHGRTAVSGWTHPLPAGVGGPPVSGGSSSVLPGLPAAVELASEPPPGLPRDVPGIEDDEDLSEFTPVPDVSRKGRSSRAPPSEAQLPTEEPGLDASLKRSERPPTGVLPSGAASQQGLPAGNDQDGSVSGIDRGELSDASVPEDVVLGTNPRDGVYQLSQDTQERIFYAPTHAALRSFQE